MKHPLHITFIVFVSIIACVLLPNFLLAQCMFRPLALNERIAASQFAVLGKLASKHCYADEKGNIYTLNKIYITAWLKNHRAHNGDIYVITDGGVVGNKAQVTEPAIQLQQGQEYFLMLENDNVTNDDKDFRFANPLKIQARVYADMQGAFPLQLGAYHDMANGERFSEETLIQKIYAHTRQTAKKPDGSLFVPRMQNSVANITAITADIMDFSPNPAIAGTIDEADFLLITGSGFGSDTGTVSFKNADDGGATFIKPPNYTDYVKWADDSIIVKIPAKAGTGKIRVNDTIISGPALTVSYAHTAINSSFSGFDSVTRQRYYLRNINDSGGYSFTYNTTSGFNANTDAKAAFERAMDTWRCKTGISWLVSDSTTSAFADDDENVVLFDATLPAGVLGRATSRFSASATGTCKEENTVWYLGEIDVQFIDTPDVGFTWQYGPALPSSSQYDFESVALHELGHAHGLGHRIASGEVMHYSISNGESIRTPSTEETDGGLAKMAYSKLATCFNPAGSGTPMIEDGCLLPVTLLSFTGILTKYGAELSWTTGNEINSSRFEIERSNNGHSFSRVGVVYARGSSNAATAYQFTDNNITKGLNYYRLKMIDKDGKYAYSGIVLIRFSAAGALVVYPNPATNVLFIESTEDTELWLTNMAGIKIRKTTVKTGLNKIDVSNISNGIYYIQNKTGNQKTRIVILR